MSGFQGQAADRRQAANRIDLAFERARAEKRLALVGLVGPSPAPHTESLEMASVFAGVGFDVVMVGLPTPYPWMEGETLQKNQRLAFSRGLEPASGFATLAAVRRVHPDLALTALTMASAAAWIGPAEFAAALEASGADGLDMADYPRVSQADPWGLCRDLTRRGKHSINPIGFNLVEAPSGTPEATLLRALVRESSGFLFLMADAGGTSGARDRLPTDRLAAGVAAIRQVERQEGVDTPVVVVCGVSTPEQVADLRCKAGADGAMIGSAFVRELHRGRRPRELQDLAGALAAAARAGAEPAEETKR